MIYLKESFHILNLFNPRKKMLSYSYITRKSNLKEQELDKLLSYLLFNNYIEMVNNEYQITKLGKSYVITFGKHKKESIKILKELRDIYPQSLTKAQASQGISSVAFRDIYYFLKEKEYVFVTNSHNTTQDLFRLGENGFILLDYFTMQSKLYTIIDDE